MCRQVGLTDAEVDNRTLGMILDYVDLFVERQNPDNATKSSAPAREATQADFDAFAAS